VSQKFPLLNCLYICQILTDFQNFCTAGKRTNYLGKLKIQIFFRYSADVEESANKTAHFVQHLLEIRLSTS